ncbi:hypothetical protein [Haliscomenobacter sp.]|uniref:hypothetical protein n=1 Tax=Haliscomenobacter sp. TaxID=2717303 RepID=UPI0035943A35
MKQEHLKTQKSKNIDEPIDVNAKPYIETYITDREGVVLKEDTSELAKVLGHLHTTGHF